MLPLRCQQVDAVLSPETIPSSIGRDTRRKDEMTMPGSFVAGPNCGCKTSTNQNAAQQLHYNVDINHAVAAIESLALIAQSLARHA
jgi:hypothetical protein